MKHVLVKITFLAAFFLLLATPSVSIEGAKNGLVLWANVVVPSLLPAMILATFLVRIQATSYLTKLLYPLLHPIYRLSKEGTFCFVTGILCGYPMGVKMVNDMLSENNISSAEANRLLAICSFPSPMFLIGYVVNSQLHCPQNLYLYLLSTYLPTLLINGLACFIFRGSSSEQEKPKTIRSSVSIHFETLEQTITDCSEIIIKIGIFMMLFSIIASWLQNLKLLPAVFKLSVSLILEMTVGISQAAASSLTPMTKLLACCFCTSFGGISTIAQTCVVITDKRLSIRNYVLWKLLHACLTVLLLLFSFSLFVRA